MNKVDKGLFQFKQPKIFEEKSVDLSVKAKTEKFSNSILNNDFEGLVVNAKKSNIKKISFDDISDDIEFEDKKLSSIKGKEKTNNTIKKKKKKKDSDFLKFIKNLSHDEMQKLLKDDNTSTENEIKEKEKFDNNKFVAKYLSMETGFEQPNMEVGREWLENQNTDETTKNALWKLLTKIKGVSAKEFSLKLNSCVDQAFSNIKNKKFVVLMNESSNGWVADLAKKMLNINTWETLPLGETKAQEFQEKVAEMQSFVWENIFFFDDGSYTGKQTSDHIRAMLKALKKFENTKISICVVIPFMTQDAFEKIDNFNNLKNRSVKVFYSQTIQTIKSEFKNSQNDLSLIESFFEKTDNPININTSVNYLFNKMPSLTWCFPGQIANIKIGRDRFIPFITPPYE